MANVFRRESIAKFVDFGMMPFNEGEEEKKENNETNKGDIKGDIKNMGNNISISNSNLEITIKNLMDELKHTRLEIENNRGRVKELQETIGNVKNDKFEHESNLVTQLQKSQNDLRLQLQTAIQSKVELCEKTSNEIDRLRKIIKLEQKKEKMKEKSGFDIFSQSSENEQDDNNDEYNDKYNENESKYNNEKKENSNKIDFEYNGYKMKIDKAFPHCDESRIDILILKNGINDVYASPFEGVQLKYTGYIVSNDDNNVLNARDQSNWHKFTSDEVGNTVYGTKLGSHENIIGLEQAVLSLTVGSKALVWVPHRLAWGVHGAENLIPPCTDIIFELDLVSVDTVEIQEITNNNDIVDMSTIGATSSLGINDDTLDTMTINTINTLNTTMGNATVTTITEQYDNHSNIKSESPFTQQYEMTSDNLDDQDLEPL